VNYQLSSKGRAMESDPNIIYGGDFDEDNNNANFASLGELILNNLQEGGDNIAFVSRKFEFWGQRSPFVA